MKKIISVLFLIASFPAAALEICVGSEYLGAKYSIASRAIGTIYSTTEETELTLWRRGDEVAHEFSNKQITEIWNRLVNGAIRPVRYFDDYERAIEYQPGEVSTTGAGRDWSTKYQLIPDGLFSQMTLEETVGEGCLQERHFKLVDEQGEIELVWLPEMQLVKSYREDSKKQSIRWTLESVVASKDVDLAFDRRAAYQSTDYADIGDNESDPFLRKMINLGFVSHGASGFYNVDGGQMGGGHQH